MKQKSEIMNKIVVFSLLFFSADTLIFGTNNDRRFIMIRYGVEALILGGLVLQWACKNKVLCGKKEIICLGLSFLVFFTGIYNNDFIMGNAYVIMMLLLGLFVSKSIQLDRFAELFCIYVKIFCLASFFLFLIYIAARDILNMLPIIVNTAGQESHTILLASIPNKFYLNQYRYSGLYREPGVFQMYLIWALMFELFVKKKLNVMNSIIFVISLLMTFSTTAYIALFLLFLCFIVKKGDSQELIIKVSILFLGSGILIYILQFTNILSADGFIFGKFSQANNPSMTARWASVVVNWMMIRKNPIWGNGLTFVDQNYKIYAWDYLGLSVTDNTNMILYLLSTFGIIYGLLFVIGIWCFCGTLTSGKLVQIGLMGIFVVLFIAQNLVFSPITYIFVFYGFGSTKSILKRDKVKNEDCLVV